MLLLRRPGVVPMLFLGERSEFLCSSICWRSEGTVNLNPEVLNCGVVALKDGAVAAVEFPLRLKTLELAFWGTGPAPVMRDAPVDDGFVWSSPRLSRMK